MMKYLLLIILFFVVLWFLRRPRNGASSAGSPAFRAPEIMVKCVRCGVNQPISESVVVDGRYYCCLDHAHDAEERGG